MMETQARRRIREAVEARGWSIDGELDWHPHFDGGEKDGIGGGWFCYVTSPDGEYATVEGLNVTGALAWIERGLPVLPEEPSHTGETK